MPRYEFSCPVCGQTFEKTLSFQETQVGVRCPSGHKNVRRVYTAPLVMFKGSGFYVTDHRSSTESSIENKS
jgi:putative FmdB family regulatory protein